MPFPRGTTGKDGRFAWKWRQSGPYHQMEKPAAQLKRQAYRSGKELLRNGCFSLYQISDAVTLCPEATFEQVIDWVRLQNGMSEQAFLNRFKRARRVYDRAQKDA
jgi:hypothetical protein